MNFTCFWIWESFYFSKNFFCFVVFFPSSWLCNCRFLRLWPFPAHLPLRYTSAFDEWGEAANPIWESKILPRLFTVFHVIIRFILTISIFIMYCMSQCDVSSDLVAFSCHGARQQYTKNCNTITMAFTLLPQGEVLAVLGHEIGHDRMYHVHTTLLLRMWVVSPQPGQSKGNRCTVWWIEDSYGVTAMIWVVNW